MFSGVELENHMDEPIRRSRERGYNPTTLIHMQNRHGTVEAMKRLVVLGEIQSGFKRLKELGLLDCSIEAAILKFPYEFTPEERKVARWRLQQAGVDFDWQEEAKAA